MNDTNSAQPARPASTAPWLVVLTAVLQIATPLLPALGAGEPIGDQSDAVRTLITPAGWAFSIWGPLYAGSIAFAIYQALPAQLANPLVDRVRWPAAGAFLGNALWAAYTQLFGLSAISAVIIVFTLGCLVAAYRVFGAWKPPFSRAERWLVVLPLSALAAWLTVATTVNIAASLRFHGADLGSAREAVGAIVVLVAAVIGALALVRGRGNPPYALVFLWALAAIHAAGGSRSEIIDASTVAAAVLIVVAAAIGLRRAGLDRWFGSSQR